MNIILLPGATDLAMLERVWRGSEPVFLTKDADPEIQKSVNPKIRKSKNSKIQKSENPKIRRRGER